MAARFIFEQVHKMSPASYSEERLCYRAEKIMLRQFVLLKQQDHIPDHFSVRDMKTWLLKGRSFLEEFQVAFEKTGMNFRFMSELAWTTARLFRLGQVEQELLEELEKEKHLSQLFSRKVTLDGFQMFVSDARPVAEEDVQSLLPTLCRKLLQISGSIHITSKKLSAGDAKPAELLELEQSTASLVPEVVDIALKFLLEKPQREDKTDAASIEIGKLLTNSVTTCLSRVESVSKDLLHSVCTTAAQYMVIKIYKTLVQRSKSFHLMDYDESFYFMSAVQNMDFKVPSDPPNKAQLEKELVEKKEASPQVSPEDMSTTESPADGTKDKEKQLSQLLKATLKGLDMFLSVVHPQVEEDVQAFLPTLDKKLLQIFGGIHISSGQLSAGDIKPPELLELEKSTAALVPKVVGTALKFLLEKPKQEDKSNAASTEIGKLLTNAVAPCLSRFGPISKGLLLGVCTITARFMVKAISKAFDQCSKSFHLKDYDESDNAARKGIMSAVHDMAYKVQADVSSQAQLEEGLLEKREASVEVTSSEEQTDPSSQGEGLQSLVEAFQRLSLNDEKDTMSYDVIEDTYRKEETLEESAVKNIDLEVQTDPLSQALPELEELLQKREASVEISSSEEQTDPSSQAQLEDGLLSRVEAFPQLSLNDEKDTMSNDVTEDTCRREGTLEESAVKNMDLEVQTDPLSKPLPQLEDELLEKREASVEVPSSEVQTDPSSQAQLEDNLLQKKEASVEVTSSEELKQKLTEKLLEDVQRVSLEDTATIVSLPDETEYISSELQQEDSKKEEPLDQDSVVQDMDRTLQTAASTHGELLVKREASPGVTVDEEVVPVQPGAVLQQHCDYKKKKQSGFFYGFQKMMSNFFFPRNK